MIKVTLYSDYRGFTMTGHAGYAKEGSDIVCAAASILATTCVNALEVVAGIESDVTIDDGYLKAILPPASSRDAITILKTFSLGIQSLVDGYGEYITLRIGGYHND